MRPKAARNLLLMAVASWTAGAAGQPQISGTDALAYQALVREYIAGDVPGAIARLNARPIPLGEQVSENYWTLFNLNERRAAALLESEAGFASSLLPVLRRRVVIADVWLQKAAKSLGPRDADTFRSAWAVVVSRRMLWNAIFAMPDDLLKDLRDKFSGNAAIHLAYGHTRESAAFSADRILSPEMNALGVARAVTSSKDLRPGALSDARKSFERVLAIDASSSEARMRLAHVHMELNEPQRAIPLLEQLLAQKTLPEYRYVGLNLLADALVRTGAVDRGIEMYTAARKLMPSAQSAYIGHARALRMAGRAGDAAVVVSAMLARPVHDDDPWARYPLGFEIELTQFDALRARVQDQ